MEKSRRIKLTAPQILVLGVIASIFIGAILLKLPISNVSGKHIKFVDSLFTATSAVCVTGLNTIIPAEQFTIFGKVVLMCLIEIGGIGFMSFIALLLLLMRKKIGLSERNLIKESLNQNYNKGIIKLIKKIFIYLGVIEIIGAIFLSIRFIPQYGTKMGIFYSIFLSISAVCNAGFDIMGSNSLINYQYDWLVSISIMVLIIVGGLGFTVWDDIIDAIKKIPARKFGREISTHTRIVLITTFILLVSGALFTFILEKDNVQIMKDDNIAQKILKSSFYSTTLRTAGFESIDSTELTTATKFISLIYMFIGGSSGSTAGGIKTTTVALLFLDVKSVVTGKNATEAFKRRINRDNIKNALAVMTMAISILMIAVIALTFTETGSLTKICYEAFSAIGTVGLSMNFTASLSLAGKLIIIVLMFFGRVGPITIVIALARKRRIDQHIKDLPEKKVLIG